ncbi:hypothetical protein SAMN05421640_0016 [Ekhidna lutea]|uniref:Uncharacterized protein n=1 Tax=Ekhidna lutea TaxID=447679 RepID=A0A239MDY4_EKHLU|nr:hypothetical protein [Ekhidna lutea]SNT40866.1 hypothetical protein SAMN05421640_0016 [Ekhidna lutea]
MRKSLLLLTLLLSINSFGQDLSQFPTEIQQVFKYILEEEYLEQFDTLAYQFRPRDWEIIDIDQDGTTEVFLWIYPHYNTSPTIVIYQLTNDGVNRIKEGLAPGPLVPRNDEYYSFHNIGSGVDFTIDKAKPGADSIMAVSSIKMKSHITRYKNFIHFDKQIDSGGYLDMTHQDEFNDELSCANFQISTPDNITSGKIGEANFFVAHVGELLYRYEISGFNDTGLLNKRITIEKIPNNFGELTNKNGVVGYLNSKGKFIELK